MSEFFRGWRRKIGVLTLMIACVFAAAWVRSMVMSDVIRIHNHILGSNNAVLSCVRCIDAFTNKTCNYVTSPQTGADTWTSIDPRWSLDWYGFHLGEGKNTGAKAYNSIAFILVPYWMFIIPLALVSAFLLLPVPCQSTQKKIPEPIGNERGGAAT